MFVDADVWDCLCKLLGFRDCAQNIVQQTLMKRQETETCWQTLSAPTASIRFYLGTDVMVIDTGGPATSQAFMLLILQRYFPE